MKPDKEIAMIFDVDDTLYDRADPFWKAICDVIGEQSLEEKRRWYHIYSVCSQEMFELHERGEITLEESRILRITKAMELCEKNITRQQAVLFQKKYEYHQAGIEMSQCMKEILDLLKEKHIKTGIMTNGPYEHQRKKMQALGLSAWIPEEYLLISERAGYVKPDLRFFKMAEETLRLQDSQIYMIGDSLESDIKGAAAAGWKTIWLNKDRKQSKELQPDYVAADEQNLKNMIQKLIEKR